MIQRRQATGNHILGGVDVDVGEANEVGPVERENIRDPMSQHRRDESGIMRLLALDAMSVDEFSPDSENAAFVAEEGIST